MKTLIFQVHIYPGYDFSQKKLPNLFDYMKDLYVESNSNVKEYAERMGYEYRLITDQTYSHSAFERFRMFEEEWDQYDTVMYCDSDFFFHAQTPDIIKWTETRPELVFLVKDSQKETPQWHESRQRSKTEIYFNSGFMIWKREGRHMIREEVNESLRIYEKSRWKDQDAINFLLRNHLDKTLELGPDWNGVMATKRPLFTTHWAGMRKSDWNPEKQRRFDLDKQLRMSELTTKQLEELYSIHK
jgi:lipopolysaccharide biosynthesis glycosyltransferase